MSYSDMYGELVYFIYCIILYHTAYRARFFSVTTSPKDA